MSRLSQWLTDTSHRDLTYWPRQAGKNIPRSAFGRCQGVGHSIVNLTGDETQATRTASSYAALKVRAISVALESLDDSLAVLNIQYDA
jgi:hypothetical protein